MSLWQGQQRGLDFSEGRARSSPSVPRSPCVLTREMLLNFLAHCPFFLHLPCCRLLAKVNSALALHHSSLWVLSLGCLIHSELDSSFLYWGFPHRWPSDSYSQILTSLSVSEKSRNVQNWAQHLLLSACFISFMSYIFISHVVCHFVEKYQKAKQLVKSKKKSGKQKNKFWKKVKLLNIYIFISFYQLLDTWI